jgi:cytochrome c-type biogenesis protein CcmH/NrfG
MKRFLVIAGLAAAATASAQTTTHQHYVMSKEADIPSPTGELAPRLQNLGNYAFPVSTKSKQAQAFVNQAVNLTYGFNHAEATRSFREAERLDPSCAMAVWGQALVLGPNINVTMNKDDEPKAYELAQKAVKMKASASPREQAYIDAVAKRYTGKADDRAAADKAYAEAMGQLAKKYPDDLDAATMYAEALMDLRPWNYWQRDGHPYDQTGEIVGMLEKVLAKSPNHPGANHYYIHAMEATKDPEKAEAAADRLLKLMPGAGHMVHMPSHIYQRVGRYADAAASNQAAVTADEDYIAQCRAQGIYPLAYYPHNIHFLWFASSAEGNSKVAIDAARKTAGRVSDEMMEQLPLLAAFKVVPWYALTRFGKWDEMLAEPAPNEKFLYVNGVYHYARGLAFLGKGQVEDAEKELNILKPIAADKALEFGLFSPNLAASILAVGPEVLAGEIAGRKKDFDTAILHLERAVRLEDALVYTEPSEWHYPPRLSLGAVLLAAGRPREAEVVYWDDLKSHPDNGWALYGLAQALRDQGKSDAAIAIQARFDKAWARADVKLTASRF